MEQVYEDFFRELLNHQNELGEFVDSLYNGGTYSADDLNAILGRLKKEGLISCLFADNRAWVQSVTFAGKYYFEDGSSMNITTKKDKSPRIFISHSSKDKEYVEKIVDLLISIGLNQNHVFCSSLPGFDIGIRKDIFEYLRNQFENYNLHVFIIHSENYYNSHVSLNEMGAAWVLRNECTSILLPGFEFGQMTGVVDNRAVSLKLDLEEREVKDKLNQIYDGLVDEFGLSRFNLSIWEKLRDKFINEIRAVNHQRSDSIDTNKIGKTKGKETIGINERYKTAVIEYLSKKQDASISELAVMWGVSTSTANRIVSSLNSDGIIETSGGGRIRKYRLANSNEQTHPIISDEAKMILEAASIHQDGTILVVRTLSGTTTQAGDKSIEHMASARDVAKMEAAMNQLINGN